MNNIWCVLYMGMFYIYVLSAKHKYNQQNHDIRVFLTWLFVYSHLHLHLAHQYNRTDSSYDSLTHDDVYSGFIEFRTISRLFFICDDSYICIRCKHHKLLWNAILFLLHFSTEPIIVRSCLMWLLWKTRRLFEIIVTSHFFKTKCYYCFRTMNWFLLSRFGFCCRWVYLS